MTGARTMPRSIAVAGAGIVGLWQALTLAQRGFSVRLIERSPQPFDQVASTRDRAELTRFARMTDGHQKLAAEELHALEPGLERRFAAGLYCAGEAHMAPLPAMRFLLEAVRAAGAEVSFATEWTGTSSDADMLIDCRGLAA